MFYVCVYILHINGETDMTMTKISVLDDNTRDATIIGFAANETEASEIFMAYMKDRMDADDFANMEVPAFAHRHETSVASPAFEPLF
jgi:hypothetical protein